MSGNTLKANWVSTLRGLVHMRICELGTASTAIRFAIAFAIIFGLLVFVGIKSPTSQFWNLAIHFFAFGFLPIYCLVMGGDRLRNELKDGTIEFLWTRPTRRSSLFLGIFFSSLAGIGAFTLVCLAAIIGAGYWLGEIGSLNQAATYSVGCLIVAVSFSALSIALGSLTSKFIVVGIIYYFLVEKLLGQIPTSARNASIIANLKPHFLSNAETTSDIVYTSPLQSIVYVAIITVIALLVGCVAFSVKSYSLGEEDK